MLLATPSLAPLLEAGTLLRKLLPSLYHGRRSPEGREGGVLVKSVCAVVDALPIPALPDGHKSGEGLGIFLSSHASRGNSFHPLEAASIGTEKESTNIIRFASVFSPVTTDASDSPKMSVARRVSLPVANTIFVNGRRTTLFEDQWNVKLSETGEAAIGLIDHRPLKSYRLDLHCHTNELMTGGSTSLHRLTKPRRVVRSMGNVLAQIEIDGEDVPASQELEKAVPAYIQSNPTSTIQGPLLVYALVRPETMLSPHKDDGVDEMRSSSSVLDDLWRGGKLFKVSGGGGGWGKRQGLLSLDAAVSFATSEVQSTAGFPDLDTEPTIAETLGSGRIIPDSSTVEFVVYAPSHASIPSPNQDHTALVAESEGTTVILGTALDPDSYDDVVRNGNTNDTEVQFVPDHFGMISYGGAALDSNIRSHDISQRRISNKHVETRLDAPDSIFVVRGVGQQ